MNAEWYERLFDLIREAQARGVAAFLFHTLPEGDVRFVSLELPPDLIVRTLRQTADSYGAQMTAPTMN